MTKDNNYSVEPVWDENDDLAEMDELGSGMRNTYKYTKLYSGGEPEFIEGDVFRTIVPLNDVSVGVVGPKNNDVTTDAATDAATDAPNDFVGDGNEEMFEFKKQMRL